MVLRVSSAASVGWAPLHAVHALHWRAPCVLQGPGDRPYCSLMIRGFHGTWWWQRQELQGGMTHASTLLYLLALPATGGWTGAPQRAFLTFSSYSSVPGPS